MVLIGRVRGAAAKMWAFVLVCATNPSLHRPLCSSLSAKQPAVLGRLPLFSWPRRLASQPAGTLLTHRRKHGRSRTALPMAAATLTNRVAPRPRRRKRPRVVRVSTPRRASAHPYFPPSSQSVSPRRPPRAIARLKRSRVIAAATRTPHPTVPSTWVMCLCARSRAAVCAWRWVSRGAPPLVLLRQPPANAVIASRPRRLRTQ